MPRTKLTKRPTSNPLVEVLKKIGCVFCETCGQWMFPDHTEHAAGVRVDLTQSRYAVVGSFGDVKLVDLKSEETVAEVVAQLPDQEDTSEMIEEDAA